MEFKMKFPKKTTVEIKANGKKRREKTVRLKESELQSELNDHYYSGMIGGAVVVTLTSLAINSISGVVKKYNKGKKSHPRKGSIDCLM